MKNFRASIAQQIYGNIQSACWAEEFPYKYLEVRVCEGCCHCELYDMVQITVRHRVPNMKTRGFAFRLTEELLLKTPARWLATQIVKQVKAGAPQVREAEPLVMIDIWKDVNEQWIERLQTSNADPSTTIYADPEVPEPTPALDHARRM